MATNVIALDDERQRQATRYARLQRRYWAVETVLGGAYLLIWIGFNLAPRLVRWLPASLPWSAALLTVALGLGLPWFVLTLPLDFYTGFVLPHRFGQSTQMLASWIGDLLKGLILAAVLGVPLLLALYVAIRQAGAAWWLWASVGFALVTVVLAGLAPVLLLPLFYKVRPLGEEFADLRARLVRMAEQVVAPVSGVFTFDMSRRTRSANAALTGLGRTRRIILGDTLLSDFTSDEIETVLAHELGHHVHADIPWSILVQSATVLAEFGLAAVGLAWAVARWGLAGPGDPAGLPILALLLGGLGLFTMPLGNAYSRWRETLADEFSLVQTRKPQAFADAMTRLANQNLAEVDPEAWVVFLLHSHPPLRDRIDGAKRFAKSSPTSG
jgi:STE24 endopeptidase